MKPELNTIPKKWQTERLVLADTAMGDASGLQAVYEDHFKEAWIKKGK